MKEGNAAWAALADDEEDEVVSSKDRARYVELWRLKQRAKGLCAECSSPREPSRSYCRHHLNLLVARNRAFRLRARAKATNGA